MYSSNRLRVSNLYDGNRITRTLAVVDYPANIDSAFSKEHQAIINGGSIGATFKANGWIIEKKNIYLGEIAPSSEYNKLYQLMGNIPASTLSVWIYVFNIRKDGKEFPYATISEVYHPDYLSLADLRCINKDANLKKTKEVKNELKEVTKQMKINFWNKKERL